MLNVLATGFASDILGHRRLLLSPTVRAESLYVYAEDSRTTRLKVDRAMFASAGISVMEIDLAEAETIASVRLGTDVDDGEAEVLAVASLRGLTMLSDDLGAARTAARIGVSLETTLDLVEAWARGRHAENVRSTLRSFCLRANYTPPRMHPLRGWFLSVTEEGR